MVYTDPDDVPWSAYLALAGVAVVVVAALLPWYDPVGETVTGLEHSDGYITAAVAVVTAAFLVGFEWNLVARIAAAIAGVLSIVVGYDAWQQVGDYPSHEAEPGLYLTVVGGGLLVIAAVWGSFEARRLASEDEDDAVGASDVREPAATDDR